MSSYEEALAAQRGKILVKFDIEKVKTKRRNLIGIRTYVKQELPAGMILYCTLEGPCAQIVLGEELGDLIPAQFALIGPSSLPKMEAANDDQERLRNQRDES